MTEQPTEPIEEITEPPEAILPIEAPAAATKSRKIRSELQLKALANARQAAYKVRAEKAELKKVKNESKKTEESHQEITEEIPDESPENISEPNKEVKEESHIERIERHAERQEFTDHINNLIDQRVQHNPIVKYKYKLVNEVYVLR
jgi:hypothetical protein